MHSLKKKQWFVFLAVGCNVATVSTMEVFCIVELSDTEVSSNVAAVKVDFWRK